MRPVIEDASQSEGSSSHPESAGKMLDGRDNDLDQNEQDAHQASAEPRQQDSPAA